MENTSHHKATERHLSYEITLCYLPPDADKCALPWPKPDRWVLNFPTPKLTLVLVTCIYLNDLPVCRQLQPVDSDRTWPGVKPKSSWLIVTSPSKSLDRWVIYSRLDKERRTLFWAAAVAAAASESSLTAFVMSSALMLVSRTSRSLSWNNYNTPTHQHHHHHGMSAGCITPVRQQWMAK